MAIVWTDDLVAQAHALCKIAKRCAKRGWVPATAGNFSFRDNASGRIFITASGLDKGALKPEDLLEIGIDSEGDCKVIAGPVAVEQCKSSAETALHGVIYRDRPGAHAILHVHSIWNSLLSDRFAATAAIPLEGYELLKALSGVSTHAHSELVPVLANSQDYTRLALELAATLRSFPVAHAVLLRRHGLYTWGESIAGAWRHLEALEFLFEVEARRLGY